MMSHGIVPGVGHSRGSGCGATHVTAICDVLLIRCRIRHHVTVGHVSIGHLIYITRQLRLLWSSAGAYLSLIHSEHSADSSNCSAELELVFLYERLCLAARPILVIRMLLHMNSAQPFRLIDKRTLFSFTKKFPFSTKAFRYFRIVHFRIFLSHLASLPTRPYHEGIHRPLYTIHVIILSVRRIVGVVRIIRIAMIISLMMLL